MVHHNQWKLTWACMETFNCLVETPIIQSGQLNVVVLSSTFMRQVQHFRCMRNANAAAIPTFIDLLIAGRRRTFVTDCTQFWGFWVLIKGQIFSKALVKEFVILYPGDVVPVQCYLIYFKSTSSIFIAWKKLFICIHTKCC